MDTLSNAGARMAAARWSKPDQVQRRVDKLAVHIRQVLAGAGELTDEQIERLRALLPPAGKR